MDEADQYSAHFQQAEKLELNSKLSNQFNMVMKWKIQAKKNIQKQYHEHCNKSVKKRKCYTVKKKNNKNGEKGDRKST